MRSRLRAGPIFLSHFYAAGWELAYTPASFAWGEIFNYYLPVRSANPKDVQKHLSMGETRVIGHGIRTKRPPSILPCNHSDLADIRPATFRFC
jgi:hypothetical protein